MRQRLFLLTLLFAVAPSMGQAQDRSTTASDDVVLGRLATGATVAFTRVTPGGWGIAVSGGAAPRVVQAAPARLEVFNAEDDIRELAAGYGTVEKVAAGIEARADVAAGNGVVFHVIDVWTIGDGGDAVVSMRRSVTVTGRAPGGYSSSFVFDIDPALGWHDVQFMAPGALYGDPTYDGDRSAGGTLNYAARRFVMREDILPAPLFALSFPNGASIAVLDPSPRGDTTVEESRLTQPVMTDARFQFGAIGARQAGSTPVEFGFWFPGTVSHLRGQSQ